MFWENKLKEEEFKRILKDKDFSAIQHAKQAARSRIYQPRDATTFRTHGYMTSLSTPHLQTKVNIHTTVTSVSIQDFVNDAYCPDLADFILLQYYQTVCS